MSLMSKFLRGLDERIAYRKILKESLDEPVPGGASWAYVLGSATLIVFMLQLGTGLVLALYYSPSATDAWASVAYLERAVTFGAFVRGVHHHAAGAMVIVAVLHMLQVALFGAYKKPREANWLSGLALLGLVLAFALTGYLLPWDQTGYWATKVATSIAGTLPVFGESIQKIAQGGNDYGNLTLTRFYAIHVIVLPLATMGLIGVHIALFRKHGITPSPMKSDEEVEKVVDRFWPKQVFYDAVIASVVVAIIVYIAVTKGAPLEAPADPASNFIARPEWYFLFLFQLLKYFEGPLQIVGTVVIPGLASGFLIALPFLDKKKSRRFGDRLPYLGALVLGLVAIGGLTALAIRHDAGDPTIATQKKVAAREAARARELAAAGVPPEGASYMLARDPLTRGERIFRRECQSCHVLEGEGPTEPKGPDLTAYATKAWIRQVLRDPDSPRLYGLTKVKGMKSYAELPKEDIQTLVDFVYAQRDPKAAPPEERAGYDKVDDIGCGNCHDFEEAYGLEGPALFRWGTAAWMSDVLNDPGQDHLYGEANEMPAFKSKLSAEDRAAVVEFLTSLGGRAPRDAWPFVDDPGPIKAPSALSE